MGKHRALAISLLALAACGSDHSSTPDAAIVLQDSAIDAKVWMDAPPGPTYDFSCMSNAAPMDGQAPANITLSGTVNEVTVDPVQQTASFDPVAGAELNACQANAANCTGGNLLAGPVDSAADGTWTLGPITTNTNPVDGYMTVTKADYKTINIYPPQTLIANQAMVPAITFTNSTFDLVTMFVTQSPANGTLAVFVTDCAGTAIEGATVSVKQNGTDVENITDFDAGNFDPAGAGVHLIFDVPPGDTEVGATLGSQTLRAHVVKTIADEMTETVVRPGYL